MKKILTLCLIMALSVCAYAQTKKIAVYVKGSGGLNLEMVRSKITMSLVQNGGFEVLDRTVDFRAADETSIVRIGKQCGVQYVCVVDIEDLFGETYFTASILDVETAQIVSSANAHDVISSLGKLTSVMETLSNRLLQSLKNSESQNAQKS